MTSKRSRSRKRTSRGRSQSRKTKKKQESKGISNGTSSSLSNPAIDPPRSPSKGRSAFKTPRNLETRKAKKPLPYVHTRLPTQVGYALIGLGFGMLVTCQLFHVHSIKVTPESLFGYGCHVEAAKPIMRGWLHTFAALICFVAMCVQYIVKGATRQPSDFVMAYFTAQYFSSAIFHRNSSPVIVSTFTIVDMAWITLTIIGCAGMYQFKKIRYVLFTFATLVLSAGIYEVFAHRLPTMGFFSSKILAGAYEENLRALKENIKLDNFVYPITIDPFIWAGLRACGGISLALIPLLSPIALNYSKYTRRQKTLVFLSLSSFGLAFACYTLQSITRLGLTSRPLIPGWHVEHVWGFHEDFHLILVIAHTFTSQLYDVIYSDRDQELGRGDLNKVEGSFMESMQIIANRISEENAEAFELIEKKSEQLKVEILQSKKGQTFYRRTVSDNLRLTFFVVTMDVEKTKEDMSSSDSTQSCGSPFVIGQDVEMKGNQNGTSYANLFPRISPSPAPNASFHTTNTDILVSGSGNAMESEEDNSSMSPVVIPQGHHSPSSSNGSSSTASQSPVVGQSNLPTTSIFDSDVLRPKPHHYIQANGFSGPKRNWVFKSGPYGLGYYRDVDWERIGKLVNVSAFLTDKRIDTLPTRICRWKKVMTKMTPGGPVEEFPCLVTMNVDSQSLSEKVY
eukprot:g3358.t1